MEQTILGIPLAGILKIIHLLREQHGLSDYSVEDLMKESGLTKTQSVQIKQRPANEPLNWVDSENQLTLLKQVLEIQKLQLIQGGYFLHVMGQNAKSQAMTWLLSKFQQQSILTIALSDNQNDLSMLEQADFAAVIHKQDGSYLRLNKSPGRVIYSQHSTPLSWQEVMNQVFVKLSLGECNE